MLLIALIIGLAIFIFVYFVYLPFSFWKKKNVPHPSVSYLFGNIGEAVLFKKSMGEICQETYTKYWNLPYVGFYKLRTPSILIRDPELVKELIVRNFNSFRDNDIDIDEDVDPLFARNPFCSTGQKWKDRRTQVTAAFTAKRIKEMHPLMEGVSKNLVEYIKVNVVGSSTGVDAKELCLKYTTDVVTTCALGLEANSFANPNSEYLKMIQSILNPSTLNTIKLLILFNLPSIAKSLKLRVFTDNVAAYFSTVIKKTLAYRKENDIRRGDFLDGMIDIQEKMGADIFTNVDITANALTFFTDGTETSSIALSFTLYELGLRPDIQTTLKNEIDEVIQKHGNKLTFEAIQDMKFLDAVIDENLRKNAPGPVLTKLCTEPFKLQSPYANGAPVEIYPGTPIIIPIHSIHHDPKHYPEPSVFDPTRFSAENVANRTKYTFLAFGEGPRICLGQRFAIAQIKVAIIQIVQKFEISVNKSTTVPYKIDPRSFLLVAEGGIRLDFHKRQ